MSYFKFHYRDRVRILESYRGGFYTNETGRICSEPRWDMNTRVFDWYSVKLDADNYGCDSITLVDIKPEHLALVESRLSELERMSTRL